MFLITLHAATVGAKETGKGKDESLLQVYKIYKIFKLVEISYLSKLYPSNISVLSNSDQEVKD